MSDVFISYSSEDRDRARMLAGILEDEGVSVWWDRTMTPGDNYDKVIDEALSDAKCVVVLWTSSAVESNWVIAESSEALKHKALVPAFLEKVEPPLEFRRIHTADLIGWEGETNSPGLENLIRAVKQILAEHADPIPTSTESAATKTTESEPAANERESGSTPPPPGRSPAPTGGGNNRWLLIGGGIAAVAVVAVIAAIFIFGGGNGGEDEPPLQSRDAAIEDLQSLVAEIDLLDGTFTDIDLIPAKGDLPLPELDEFPLVVDPTSQDGVVVEIFVSTEKSGSGTDGWMVEVAERFNAAAKQLADGRPAKVAIRKIASGTAFEFIKQGQPPDAYSPSNHLWIEMARASGRTNSPITMTPIRDQLVPNLAGLVVKTEKAAELEATYGTLSVSSLVDAVIADDVVMAYTDPFISSTGLNFLVAILWELSGKEEDRMLSSEVTLKFQAFQDKVPFFAGTTLQLRDSVCGGGELEALIMEWQTFAQATDCFSSGFEFIPFGLAHENPLYAVGDVSQEKLEVLELFAQHIDQFPELAIEFGFDPPSYESYEPMPTLSGSTLLDAQKLWKDEKDSGKPVTAIFVTDVSGSMSQRGSTDESRIDAVQEALLAGMGFINDRNYVGMVTFNNRVTNRLTTTPFDQDQQGKFAFAANHMSADGGTAMYDAIAIGLDLLLKEEAERPGTKLMLIVLTDGVTDEGLKFDDLSGVIGDLRIPIHTIGFEADLAELERVSALVEGAISIDADIGNVGFEIARLFNREL